ncbi:DNA repair protein RadA [Klugiella xanthotipulae]|uniref:DNA repair protein RadA n=1 Tax=Klugiella xanthotipulae TaxID=244735 RepID=A0A543I5G9_9MICO|nr:DNA repair protein RadA [Klugiella xanthotipulae]TQM65856.1 DNA repair protein RadA/Sms [Klugiella xanthotipulae]
MAKVTTVFRCTECGWQAAKWVGRCGECQAWGTVVDAAERTGLRRTATAVAPSEGNAARPITHVSTVAAVPTTSGVAEFDRVLGGGIVPGAAILLSGEPGVGKSTLLLEVASQIATSGQRVLYVSAEESVGQVRIRAERTDAMSDNLFLAAETDLASILGQVDAVAPALLIADSVQTIASDTVDGIAGGPSQVREVASTLIRLAKTRGLPVILVGHVTKDGTIAGPRLLEHLVDVVCHFEGDRRSALRFIRALKNRFGPTDEVGCFEMTGDGIAQVTDPSGLFLSRSDAPVSGTCVTVAMEGRRALPVEVQALIVDSSAPNPRRVTSGVDSARVAMILAVLERRAGVAVGGKDVYVSTVGGVRLTEPAADLAIALAIASAAADRAYGHGLVAYGEISLAGEVRAVTADRQRESEARRLGFGTVVDASAATLAEALRLAQRTAGPAATARAATRTPTAAAVSIT